jgi:DNA modification methylase
LSPSDPEYVRLQRSIERWDIVQPLVWNQTTGNLVGGHQRLKILAARGDSEVTVSVVELGEQDEAALNVALNKISGDWDMKRLGDVLSELDGNGYDATLTGFDVDELADILGGYSDDDEAPIPEPPANPDSVLGEVYELGPHRLMCGDSTNAEHVAKLMGGVTDAPLLHADPPYGMGKEGDGVLNDNLYNDKLDAFQMAWWRVWRPFVAVNGSAYIWGNPEALWRLWWRHLEASEEMTFRNSIVWDKGAGFGQTSASQRCYSVNTERLLFFMLGRQFFGNVNKDDFFEGYEPIRAHLEEQCKVMGWGGADIKRLCGVQMYGHWFTKSQWTMIPEKHYRTLQDAAGGKAFVEPYAEVKDGHIGARDGGGHLSAAHSFNEMRAFFDNTHDNMNEVWSFPRVQGEERQGHATPKPVAVCARAIRSSAPVGAVVLEPFGGSGSTLIAAESVGRVCYMMELDPGYCDVIRQRYANYEGT